MRRTRTAILGTCLALTGLVGCDSPSEAEYIQDLAVLSITLDGERQYPIEVSAPAQGRVGDTVQIHARTFAMCDWTPETELDSSLDPIRVRLYNRRPAGPGGPCADVLVPLEHTAYILPEEPGPMVVEVQGLEAETPGWWERNTPPDTIVVTQQIEISPRQ